ncbi:MAG: flavin reductase family protein [Lentisphaerae bacterium]|nr:flavin reductase family protein [Lentisphaerota bacterium]MBT5604954.1 flavin reductase family protein [Lentisphaerota bacterium]MBT7056452.1 flavin reductase family protein [Lentisphaerota bacterium]MBT7844299.1 flavin reductase family protein [Lentisphaerota bacterium]
MVEVVFLTTVDSDGRVNVMTVNPLNYLAQDPYLVGVTLRPSRHSHGCVQGTGQFVLSVPSSRFAKHLNYCGIVSGRDRDKIEDLQLPTIPADEVLVPRIADCIAYFECEVDEIKRYGSHDLFVGKRVCFHEPAWVRGADGDRLVRNDTVPVASYTGYDFWCLGAKLWEYTRDPSQLLNLICEERSAQEMDAQ